MCFAANFAKFLRATFLKNTSGRLLLYMKHQLNSVYIVSRKFSTKYWNDFLKLLSKHLPKASNLHKIFNGTTVKRRYKAGIGAYLKKLLSLTVTQYGSTKSMSNTKSCL